MLNERSRRLVLAHFWIAFIAFVGALLLGEWQMWIRSPLHAWLGNPDLYYRSVTAHGSAMGYVFPTLVAMGFGYAIVGLSLKQPLIGLRWAWAGFILVVLGTVCAMVPVSMGLASVLYTFYPPMIGNPFFYLGIVLVVIGSWIWVALMSINLHAWKKANPGAPVPLPMFANVAGAYLWAWTSLGAAIEILFQILPAAVGLTATIDAGLARIFFSWTLHAIVYFWLMPAYIAFYTIIPRAMAISYGMSGPCLRGSGVAYDVRKDRPYSGYEQYDFDVPVGTAGDCYDRYLVRMEEIRQSLRIIDQALQKLPGGPVLVDDKRVALPPKSDVYSNIEALMNHFKLVYEGILAPPGEVYGYTEAANGELGYYIVSDGRKHPWRVKVRPPCFNIYQAFPQMIKGRLLADAVAIIGGLNVIAGELDR